MNSKISEKIDSTDKFSNNRLERDTHENCTWAPFGQYKLTSHYQPIISLPHCGVIGHEGLMRATDSHGANVAPLDVIESAEKESSLLALDELCNLLHVRNATGTTGEHGWLFLNMHPAVFVQKNDDEIDKFTDFLKAEWGFPSNRVVIEILEQWMADSAKGFSQSVAQFRERGFLIALDDFGAGHSNFDRVWQLKPEIVKLDRCFSAQIESDSHVRRLLPRIVTLLHEAGALVLLEGIETEAQAMMALEADIDFAQGYYFAKPAPTLALASDAQSHTHALWNNYEARVEKEYAENRMMISLYENALQYASVMLSAGKPLKEACSSFLELSRSEYCFLLDQNARQIGENLPAPHLQNKKQNFLPLVKAEDARWSRRSYFRRANEYYGRICRTRPYLSVGTASLCITLSIKFRIGNDDFVLCGDISCE